METTYFSLASKNNFNKALRHFFKVNDVVGDLESNMNLADVINSEIDSEDIHTDQILPIVGAVIRDKFGYSYSSCNIPATITEFEKIAEETAKWTALDIVIVYFNASGKVVMINPKNPDHWSRARELVREQLIVIYTKFRKEENKKLEIEAITAIEEMIAGKDVFINKEFIDETIAQQKPVKQAQQQAPKKSRNVTPKYAVRVSNELFHNGNVEAWKKIVESYTTKFPDLQVYIYHKGELILDINSLFKWGKVKHSDSIFFQVGGENIRGVSKLQKYLFEGASPRYEQFLKIDMGKVLNLF